LTKSQRVAANRNLVSVPQAGRLLNASLVQKRAVAAAEINEPEHAGTLRMNYRVQPRNFCRVEDQAIERRSADRTTRLQNVLVGL
jgi:hypothetical protein